MSYIFLFYWVCFLKDLCIVRRKVSFISRNKTLVATVWSIKLLKAPPIFLSLPERNIKLSVFPSDWRMEISSLSIKVSRSFISIPEGLKALTQFIVALLFFSFLYSLFSPILPICFLSTRGPFLDGWGCTLPALHPNRIDWGPGLDWGYRFQSGAWEIGAERCCRP